MAAKQKKTKEEEFLIERDRFRRNAVLIIKEMVELSPNHPAELVDEILHSIFFLGKLSCPEFSPKNIIDDDDMLNALKGCYPLPFVHYSSQLPRRSPMSCMLDMMVNKEGQKNEDKIKERLQELTCKLKEGGATDLVSSTICVSQPNSGKDSVRYYGVSMSTSGSNPGKIVVAAACFRAWDSYVAGAVMTYYPEAGSKRVKKPYFDGTIKLPKQVRCEAFSLTDGNKMDPCKSCGNLFGLTTSVKKEWPYGHCAEAESVSNLLKNERDVREQAKPKSETCTDVNREKAEKSVRKELTGFLKTEKFKWNNEFYTPQKV